VASDDTKLRPMPWLLATNPTPSAKQGNIYPSDNCHRSENNNNRTISFCYYLKSFI